MCEYIQHLEKFKKYKYPCKRKTKDILESKDSLILLLDCLNINTLESNIVYVFYRTDKVIHHSIKLNAKKEKNNIKRLEDLKSEIIEGSEGYLELYVFNDENKSDKNQFNKLYNLINEFCDIDKINSDYDSNFTHSFAKLAESFLLLSYDILTKYSLVIIGILFTGLIISIYTELINHGYPYELIDHASIIFLTKLYLSSLGYVVATAIGIIILYALLYKLSETNKKGEKKYKLIFTALFYLMIGTIIYSIRPLYTEKSFLQVYNDIHTLPRLMKSSNYTYYVIGMKKRIIYAYKLDSLLNKDTIENMCKSLSNNEDFNSLSSIIMSESTEMKNISIMYMNDKIMYLDSNDSTTLIKEEYCQNKLATNK